MSKPSNWYYLLPIFMSIIGGVIMYFVLKDKDKKMARNGLILGVALVAVTYIISLSMPVTTLSYVSPLSMLQR